MNRTTFAEKKNEFVFCQKTEKNKDPRIVRFPNLKYIITKEGKLVSLGGRATRTRWSKVCVVENTVWRHSWYFSQLPPPQWWWCTFFKRVSFFAQRTRDVVLFWPFWLFCCKFRQFLVCFTGLNNAVVSKIWQISGMYVSILEMGQPEPLCWEEAALKPVSLSFCSSASTPPLWGQSLVW